jgi:hypothetical protein
MPTPSMPLQGTPHATAASLAAYVHLDVAHEGPEEIRVCVRAALDYLQAAVLPWDMLQPGALTDLLLAGAELVDNALRHVGECTVRVRWLADESRARLEVADTSAALPVLAAPGGPCRGLRLVQDVTAFWGCERSPGATGKVVFVEVNPHQSLTGDERLAALLRRHPQRATGEQLEGDIAAAVSLAAAESRELVSVA